MRSECFSMLKAVALALAVVLLTFCPIQIASSQVTDVVAVKAVPSTSSPVLDETLTVDITITNVQNLYGLDVSLRWNNSVLEVLSATPHLGVESNPEGVLHEILPDASVYVGEDNASQALGEYHLLAISISPAPSFNGSGTIATLTFKVASVGHSELSLETELADRPPLGEHSNLLEHTDVGSSIDSLPVHSTPVPTDWTPIVLLIILVAAILFIIAFALCVSHGKRKPKNPEP